MTTYIFEKDKDVHSVDYLHVNHYPEDTYFYHTETRHWNVSYRMPNQHFLNRRLIKDEDVPNEYRAMALIL